MAHTSMPTDADPPVATWHLDHLPAEALGALLRVELPGLTPAFGVTPDAGTGEPGDSDALWARLLRVMDDPVQVFRWRGDKRVVHVLRHCVLVVWASGRISALRWHVKPNGEALLIPVDPGSLDLFHMATRSDWHLDHRNASRWERVRAHVAQGGSFCDAAPRLRHNRLFAPLRLQILDHMRHNRLDARIRAAMGLDPEVMRWAVSLVGLKSSPRASEVRVRSYNWVLMHRQALVAVTREAPELVQWYAACAQRVRFPQEGEAVQRVKRFLKGEGVGRLGWLLALKAGHRIWGQASRWTVGKHALDQAVDLLKAHEVLGRGELLPAGLLRLWRDHWGDQLAPSACQRAALTHMADLWRQQPPMTEQGHADWREVMDWFAAEGVPVRLNAWHREQGLPYLLRGAKQWREREARRWRATLKPLYVWHTPIESGEWRVEFMRTHRDLIEEGRLMGNCLADSRPGLSYDTLFGRVYQQGEHVGTALYKFSDGNWYMTDIRGRFNSEWPQAEAVVLQIMGRQIQQPQFQPPTTWSDSEVPT